MKGVGVLAFEVLKLVVNRVVKVGLRFKYLINQIIRQTFFPFSILDYIVKVIHFYALFTTAFVPRVRHP
jgi:hypothetical protein